MHWIDWVIVACPILIVFSIAWRTQRYVTGVSDFLTAGRVAGRYVVSVASGEAAMGLVSLVAIFEMYYNSGFAFQFWNGISAPIGLFLGLSGYCIYRFRETRAMTMGQFFEMRYSRKFRIFAAILQSTSGVINYAIFPAVSARFIIYYCNLPLHFDLFGMTWATFHAVMLLFLGLAVLIVTRGGQITVMVCDCVQGLLNYPMMAIVVIAILFRFSWFDEMAPTLLDREAGKSMLNPFDVHKLRTFNLFYVMVGVISNVFNRMAWSGTQGYNTAALNAHEQKMGQVLGTWRTAFNIMLYPLLAIAAYTLWHNANFAGRRAEVRQELAQTAIEELAPAYAGTVTLNDAARQPQTLEQLRRSAPKQAALLDQLAAGDGNSHPGPALSAAGSDVETLHALRRKGLVSWDMHALSPEQVETRIELLKSENPALHKKTMTIHNQMRVPLTLRYMLPIGITGVLCAIAIFLMISTDTTYLHSWGSIIVQDVILPLRGRPFTPKQQLTMLRLSITGVAAFAFVFSSIFAQVDFIIMFFAITGAIWLGGAGSCIVFGLYWKRGTTAGAWSSLVAGSSIATTGFVVQHTWVSHLYPWLQRHDLIDSVSNFFASASAPFEPFIVWRVTAASFPMNSQEIYFLALVVSITLYVSVSLLTCKQPFNMERLLHRGQYHREGPRLAITKWNWSKLLGINENYTRGDRILAWSVFIWSFVFRFCIVFLGFTIWNLISPWPKHWWANWFWIDYIYVMGLNATITVFWFGICGTRDLIKMFRRLDARTEGANVLDDGRVEGNISAVDIAMVAKVEEQSQAPSSGGTK